ncbi:beta-lactamase family protein [Saccharothrix sp. AJ9571]|nr:beta-lactamase family protein [Saccharothrix sp. AJ9571]
MLNKLVERHHVPGAQLAVYHRGEVATAHAGVTHWPSGRPMTATTTVPVGSITKAFTATLAMVLVAESDLDLDAPVGDTLRGHGLERVTLRHLLGHTGGLPSDPAEHCGGPRALLTALAPDALVCAPGTAFSYSNIGYALIGLLIEEVTGMSWQEAVTGIVLQPLDLHAAFVGGPGPRPTGDGHVAISDSQVRVVEQLLSPVLMPAGGLALSAGDLVEFGRVHLGKPGLLDVVTASEMHTAGPAEPFGLADGWALGLACFRGPDGEWHGHDGTADGTSCHLRIDGDGQTVVALTTNAVGGTALWRELLTELTAFGIEVPDYRARSAQACRIPLPRSYFGCYRNGDIEYVVGTDPAGAACLTVDGDVHSGLHLYDCGTVSLPDPATGVRTDCGRFLRDAGTGAVTAMQVGGRLARRAGF